MKRRIIFVLCVCAATLSACTLKMNSDKLSNIIENDQILYTWAVKGSLKHLDIYDGTEKLGSIYEQQNGVVSKVFFQYADGRGLMFCSMGDYTWPKKLTQSNDKYLLHLFYFDGISLPAYKAIEFNIKTSRIETFGLAKGNNYYDF